LSASGACKWPIGDPACEGFRFCGEAATQGRAYCNSHEAIAYVKTRAEPPAPEPRIRIARSYW
jgi:hypothetical protein